jgi:hypothetical protein
LYITFAAVKETWDGPLDLSPDSSRERRKMVGCGWVTFLLTKSREFTYFYAKGTILATDMSWHFEWVERFGRAMKDRRAMYKRNQGRSIGGSPELVVNSSGSGAWVVVEQDQEAPLSETDDPHAPEQPTQEEVDREDRLFMCQAMMKCADISNPVSIDEWSTSSGAD